MLKLYFVAGEASGDSRGAELMRSLRSRELRMDFFGRGGPQMQAVAGPTLENWTERAAVLGFIDVVKNYGYFKTEFDKVLAELSCISPDAVIFIDYPGFNLRLAKAVKQKPAAPKVIYYVSPQVWAWNRGRIPKMARIIDLMMCIFPFEKELYEQSGLKTVFVGHPMLDSLAVKKIDQPRDEKLVGLFPGSRKREVKKIFPVMLAASIEMKAKMPELRFEAPAASPAMAELMRSIAGPFASLSCNVTLHNSHELMQRAAVGMVASGTATMEAAYFRLPFALLYRAAWLTFFIGRKLVKVPFLGMPNILAGREIVREFLQEEALPKPIADHLVGLLENESRRAALVAELDAVIAMLGTPGASDRAAAAVLEALGTR